MAACMLAACVPWRPRIPAWRSNELNSFMSRLLRRVHDADSYEHQAVPTVASAMIKAVSGSIHFRLACAPLSGGKLSLEIDTSCRLLGQPCSRLREFIRRKEFYRCAPDSCPRKSQRLHLPARVRHESDLGDLATVRKQKIEIIPIGAAFPAAETFADNKETRFCAGVDFVG